MREFREEDLPTSVGRRADPYQRAARERLTAFFERHRDGVFFSRQLEVRFEGQFLHWVTNRAIGDLVRRGLVETEPRRLKSGGVIHLLWHRRNRYYRRAAAAVVGLVDDYAAPGVGETLGLHGEWMVWEGFARNGFVLTGRETNAHQGRKWKRSAHDMDFVLERDGVSYGVEVKNTLGYMDYDELTVKVRLCKYLRLRPVFVCRMLPKTWIYEVC